MIGKMFNKLKFLLMHLVYDFGTRRVAKKLKSKERPPSKFKRIRQVFKF